MTLPLSTGGHRSINLDYMEAGYNAIAESIHNLAYTQRVHSVNDINTDLTGHVINLAEYRRNNMDVSVICQCKQTICDLENKHEISHEFQTYMCNQIRTMNNRNNMFPTGGNVDNLDITNESEN